MTVDTKKKTTMTRPGLSQLALCFLGLLACVSQVHALTDEEKSAKAEALIDAKFHSKDNPSRQWALISEEDIYRHYEVSNKTYCTDGICWQISVHVHAQEHAGLDRIYLFDTSSQPAYLGTAQVFGQWTDYDLFAEDPIHVRRPECMQYCRSVDPQRQTTAVIKHTAAKDLTIAIDPAQTETVITDGALHGRAQWEMIPVSGGAEMRLQSLYTGRFLRIKNETTIDADGGDGDKTVFKVHRDGKYFKLESKRFPGRYLAVKSDGQGMKVGSGGKWTRLEILAQ